MGLPNLTPEEEYLLKKFALLKKKVNLGFLLLYTDLFSAFLFHIRFANLSVFPVLFCRRKRFKSRRKRVKLQLSSRQEQSGVSDQQAIIIGLDCLET